MMATVLIAVVLASLVLTYGTLTRGAEQTARERIAGAVTEVVGTVDLALAARGARLHALAQDEHVHAALRSPPASPHLSLSFAEELTDSERAYPSIVLDSSGAAVLSVGDPSNAARRELRRLGASIPDTVRFGRMFADGEAVFFWSVAPVVAGASRLGTLAQLRRVGGPREATSTLSGLVGEDVALYIRNIDDSLWVAARGGVESPQQKRDTSDVGYVQQRGAVGRVLGVEAPIAGAPWIAALEVPLATVHERARKTTVELSLLALILATIGALAAWVISRSITGPLAELSRAAGSVARGAFPAPVAVERQDEIGRLAASFNRMADEVDASRRELERKVEEADKANRTKSDFLAVMSHELRTPLNAIGGYTQLLGMELYGPLNDAQRDAVKRLERSQAHLLRLINNVLSFSRIDSGQLAYQIEQVKVDEALSELEDLIAPQIRARGIKFVPVACGEDVVVAADSEKLQQVILNLLSNAIKFTPSGGRITIGCRSGEGVVQILVEDTGCGIDPEALPTIFDPFVQANRSLHRPNEGVGLGLAIARDLARGMGGDLTVRSEPGNGSTFVLSLRTELEERSRYMHPVARTSLSGTRH
jgi:signal transduction histidine kinase